MSFNTSENTGKVYAPGWFLAHEECERKTRQIKAEGAVTGENGGKYVPMGTIYPSNNGSAVGIVYEDVDVTTGDMPGSVVLSGIVYENRLPEELNGAAKTALTALGFVFRTESEVTRPDWTNETAEKTADENTGEEGGE